MERYWLLETLNPTNRKHAEASLNRGDFAGIVDEKVGGIVAYGLGEHSEEIVRLLNRDSVKDSSTLTEEDIRRFFERKVEEWLEEGPEEVVRVLTLWASPDREESLIRLSGLTPDVYREEMACAVCNCLARPDGTCGCYDSERVRLKEDQ